MIDWNNPEEVEKEIVNYSSSRYKIFKSFKSTLVEEMIQECIDSPIKINYLFTWTKHPFNSYFWHKYYDNNNEEILLKGKEELKRLQGLFLTTECDLKDWL